MLAAALGSSDRVFVTSDNPRSEDPRAIAGEILAGAAPADLDRVVVELDRGAAIERAIREAGERDVILLLGKGHESDQIVGAERLPWSDAAVAAAALARA